MTSGDRHQLLEAARKRAELTVQELWLRFVALGGTGDAFDIDGYLQGLVPLDTFQQDVLTQAANEGLEDIYRSARVPLSAPSPDGTVDDRLREVIQQLLGDDLPARAAKPGEAEHGRS